MYRQQRAQSGEKQPSRTTRRSQVARKPREPARKPPSIMVRSVLSGTPPGGGAARKSLPTRLLSGLGALQGEFPRAHAQVGVLDKWEASSARGTTAM